MRCRTQSWRVSVLFNEPKLLKYRVQRGQNVHLSGFSALQRAEIAEMQRPASVLRDRRRFSALQRAEIAEILPPLRKMRSFCRFSALQRAEIAEIQLRRGLRLFGASFSALQRAEIAEISPAAPRAPQPARFQCSSTSRNC